MRIWERFPEVAARVRKSHEDVGLVGHHDWVHAFRVAEVAYQCALEEWPDDPHTAELAGLAGLCHNADRILQEQRSIRHRQGLLAAVTPALQGILNEVDLKAITTAVQKISVSRRDVPSQDTAVLVTIWLNDALNADEAATVIDAVLKHDGRNGAGDSRVLIALQDGDRIVNLDTDLFVRSGQFYHELPVWDYRYGLNDPEATYRNPKTVARDIDYAREWTDPATAVCVRTRKAKEMAVERVKLFNTFFDALKGQLTEEGIMPYPFA